MCNLRTKDWIANAADPDITHNTATIASILSFVTLLRWKMKCAMSRNRLVFRASTVAKDIAPTENVSISCGKTKVQFLFLVNVGTKCKTKTE